MDRGLTQKTFARRVSRSISTVSGWERGHHEPTAADVPTVDRALRVPIGTTSSLLSRSPAYRDVETFTLRSLLPPGATDSVTVAVLEDLFIGEHGVGHAVVRQRLHGLRGQYSSYWFIYAQGPDRPRLRVTPRAGCLLGGFPRLLTAGRVAQEIKLAGPPLRIGEERDFAFVVTYGTRDNPIQETGLHRRVGTPTLSLLKMRVTFPQDGALVTQCTWPDRYDEPTVERAHLLRQPTKVLHWSRPDEHSYGITWRLR